MWNKKQQQSTQTPMAVKKYIHGLVQDCNNSSALAMELLQSCTKPLIYRSTSTTWTNSQLIAKQKNNLFVWVGLGREGGGV